MQVWWNQNLYEVTFKDNFKLRSSEFIDAYNNLIFAPWKETSGLSITIKTSPVCQSEAIRCCCMPYELRKPNKNKKQLQKGFGIIVYWNENKIGSNGIKKFVSFLFRKVSGLVIIPYASLIEKLIKRPFYRELASFGNRTIGTNA